MKTIKLCYLLFAITGLLVGCYDFNTVQVKLDDWVDDPSASQRLVGTYIFKPDAHQAERLNLRTTDSVVLKILSSSSIETNNDNVKSWTGKYEIDKMVLGMNIDHQQVYRSTWRMNFIKETGDNGIGFNQNLTNNQNMGFQLEHYPGQDTLHIMGYTSDPKYEVFQIVDFKKVK